jgi:hypothetical protein
VRCEPRDGSWTCEVSVEDTAQKTSHTVSVTGADLARWGRGDDQAAVEDLVQRSFAFLLEREPPGSILRRFDLAVIQRYFPEYDLQLRP